LKFVLRLLVAQGLKLNKRAIFILYDIRVMLFWHRSTYCLPQTWVWIQ